MANEVLLTHLSAISASLKVLKDNKQLALKNNAEEELGEVQAKAKIATPDSVAGAQTAVTALAAIPLALPGITAGVLLAINGFNGGDPITGSQGVMDTCASLAPLIGSAVGAAIGFAFGGIGAGPGAVLGGLIGSAIAAIFSMISEILAFFAPQVETLAMTISTALKDQKADEVYSGIGRVHRSFYIYATTLNDQCKKIESDLGQADRFQPAVAAKVIDQLNFVEGNTMTTYWDAVDWLSSSVNQKHPLWPTILNATCDAYSILLMAVVRLQTLVVSGRVLERYTKAHEANDQPAMRDLKDLWSSAQAKLQVYATSNQINLRQLKQLRQAAQDHGTFWSFSPGLEMGLVAPDSPISSLGGYSSKLTVTVCSKDQALLYPAYHQYAITGKRELYYWRVASRISNGKLEFRENLKEDTFSWNVDDVFALPGIDQTKPNHAIVYTVSEGKKIEGRLYSDAGKKLLGDKDKALDPVFSYTLPSEDPQIESLLSVRAVYAPYTYPEDPAGNSLAGVKYVVYSIGKPKSKAAECLLFFPNGKDRYPLQIDAGSRGIALDQDYLWLVYERKILCFSHASLIYVPQSHLKPAEIVCPNLPTGSKINLLYPSDDGTLTVEMQDHPGTFTAAYKVDLVNKKITSPEGKKELDWKKIRDRPAVSFEKLPLFCWPQYESLTDTLEAMQTAFNGRT